MVNAAASVIEAPHKARRLIATQLSPCPPSATRSLTTARGKTPRVAYFAGRLANGTPIAMVCSGALTLMSEAIITGIGEPGIQVRLPSSRISTRFL